MAKASPIDGLGPDLPLGEAARRTLAVRLLDVRTFEDAILYRRDADAVHDMRVATRRLRAAIGLYDAGGRLEEAALEVKALGRALGKVRDLDVQLEWLDAALGHSITEGERAGIAALHGDRRARLAEPEAGLTDAVKRWQAQVAPRLEQLFADVDGPGRLGGSRMRKKLRRRLRRVDRGQKEVLASADAHTAHQLRIAVKKLRYECELLQPALPELLPPFLATLQPLQELLGELHDTDEHQALLERQLLQAPPPNDLEQLGVLWLLKRALGDRERLSVELLVDLRRWQADRVCLGMRERLA